MEIKLSNIKSVEQLDDFQDEYVYDIEMDDDCASIFYIWNCNNITAQYFSGGLEGFCQTP